MVEALQSPEFIFNEATVRERWGLEPFLEGCAARGLSRASLWGEEVDKAGLEEARRMLSRTGISTFGFNRAGPLLAAGAAGRAECLDRARRAVDMAAELAADHVLVFSGGLAEGSRDLAGARAQTEDAIGALLDHARSVGMTLALEPLHPMVAGDRAVILSLSHANAICEQLGEGIGIVADAYHIWWDERLETELSRAGAAGRILGFHVSDWLVPTKHVLRDRGMMGDGIIDLAGMWRQVRAAGYDGPVEIEIFSDRWWAEDPDLVLDTALARCRSIFWGG
ncbi:xylose isomerase [Nitratireductor indicus C115]|uniref:Xylose isomerase n=1 Tax=Nitratireductor indicus C115 TaxID=1231190 RepID=K2P7F3_9HYPH|nr:sugar phosphate isomerase/epimerase family protein [Nitratireductor indicus]EKF43151.1 xylose isomerase [Nitratireductor indicus C115]SFQ53183.1 Sugar phosphate isomerase/epimerase [Nitratireductor indicus]